MHMTKTAVKDALGFSTDAELARFFDIGRWAVGQWPEDAPIGGRHDQARTCDAARFTTITFVSSSSP